MTQESFGRILQVGSHFIAPKILVARRVLPYGFGDVLIGGCGWQKPSRNMQATGLKPYDPVRCPDVEAAWREQI